MTTTHSRVLRDWSLEMTAKDMDKLHDAKALIPRGSRVNVTYLGNEDAQMRRHAIRAVAEWGFIPIPHISARRLVSEGELVDFARALEQDGTGGEVFVIGGDPAQPEGPYDDALSVIRSGVLRRYGTRTVGVAGYPEGHPDIPTDRLWAALEAKSAALADQGSDAVIVTQFGFAVDPVISWIEAVRDRGITSPIRIGVPGPAGIKRLLGYARRFGVGTSAGIVKKYGFSLTNLMGTAGPGAYIEELAGRLDTAIHGEIAIHFYTFGGLTATAEWVRSFEGNH